VCLNKNIKNVAICINCTPKPVFHAIDWNDDFIQMPFVGGGGSIALDAGGELAAKPVHPEAYGFTTDYDTPFRE